MEICLSDDLTEAQCLAQNGEWAGPGTVCAVGCPLCDDGDVDQDGDVDVLDLAEFQMSYGPDGATLCRCCDMNFDVDVDAADMALFLQAMLGPTP
jgi:hypothetical protein